MAYEVLFSRKNSKVIHPSFIFNRKDVSRSESHKHLGLVFDPKLNFDKHLKGKFSIINNGIALLRKLRHSIPRKPLISIYNLIPSVNRCYDTRNNTNVPSFKCRAEYFKNSFFPNVKTEWNKLDINIKSITSYTAFKNALSSFIRPKHVDTFGIHNPTGLQLLTRLRLGFSH